MIFAARQVQQCVRRGTRGVSQVLADSAAWNVAPTTVSTLPNGVRVATQQTSGGISSVGVFVDGGVRNETKEASGTAFLLQKLATAGTKKRPKAMLEADVEGMGGLLDVQAGRESMSYTLSGGDVSKSVDILADLVAAPGLENLEKEKAGILRAYEESDVANSAVVADRLHQCAFRDGPLGYSVLGPYDGIERVTSADLASYTKANYTAGNVVLAVAGPHSHAELVKLASSSPLASLPKSGAAAVADTPYFCGAELNYRNDEMGATAYFSVGYKGVPARSADAVALQVCASIIGSYKKNTGLVPGTISGNRTINNVANKMHVGCADEFEAFSLNYKDAGVFGFYAACDEVAVEHCMGELQFSVNMLAFSVTDEEVERGKRELKQKLYGGSGSAADACTSIGAQMLAYGRVVPPAEMLLRIDGVDREEVNRVAWQYLNDCEVAVTGLGPLHGMPQYMDIRRATTMHRY